MANVQTAATGEISVTSLDGTISYTGVATTAIEPESVSLNDAVNSVERKNKRGATVSRTAFERVHTMTVEAAFKDGTDTAGAKAATVLATPLAIVTLASFGVAGIDGTWNYDGGTYNGRAGDVHKYTLNLYRVSEADGTPASLAVAS